MERIKDWFSTNKKAVMVSLSAAVVLLIVISAALAVRVYAGINSAKKAAVADAGVNEADVYFKRAELEFEHGRFMYEIEFFSKGAEYEYIISAENYQVLKKETEPSGYSYQNSSEREQPVQNMPAEQDVQSSPEQQPVQNTTAEQSTAGIPSETPAQSASPANPVLTEQSESDSRYIGIERAKEIAASHAGIALSEAMFSKAKTDRDKGRYIYEIEFYSGGFEYEYEIDALSGAILDFEKDSDR